MTQKTKTRLVLIALAANTALLIYLLALRFG